MKHAIAILISLPLALLIYGGLLDANAQSSSQPKQAGVLNLSIDEKGVDPYSKAQNDAIDSLKTLEKRIAELSSAAAAPIPNPSADALHHLTGVYLYCTISKGACPDILDALLEIDLINSRLAKKVECPSLLGFWRDWKSNDMETRQKHLLRIGTMSLTNEFSRTQRPKYIKCQETLQPFVDEKIDDAEFFKKRYAAGTPIAASVSRALNYTQSIAQSIPEVFVALDNMK